MKALTFIAAMAIVGGIGGAAYGEYDRLTSAENNARLHVLTVSKVYKKDSAAAIAAATVGVKQCAAELYFVEFPPVLTEFMAKTAATDYEIVKKFGLMANQHTNELEDLRNVVSNLYYDKIDREIANMPEAVTRKALAMMKDYRKSRKKIARCINEKAYYELHAQKLI